MKTGRVMVVSYSILLIVIGVYLAVQGIFHRDTLMFPFSDSPWLMLILGFIFIAGGILNMGRSLKSVFCGGRIFWKDDDKEESQQSPPSYSSPAAGSESGEA